MKGPSRLVRGLDYYNRTVFEYISLSYQAAQDALGGGGRYDPLAELLGGAPTAGVGFAIGVDRVVLAMPETGEERLLDVFVTAADAGLRPAALDLVADLRSQGLRADLDLGGRSLKAQFRAADRRGAAAVVVVGSDWEHGQVTCRRLDTGEEQTIRIEEVPGWMKRR